MRLPLSRSRLFEIKDHPRALAEVRTGSSLVCGRLPERTNGAASKAVVASGLPRVRIPHLPPILPRPPFGAASSAFVGFSCFVAKFAMTSTRASLQLGSFWKLEALVATLMRFDFATFTLTGLSESFQNYVFCLTSAQRLLLSNFRGACRTRNLSQARLAEYPVNFLAVSSL